MLGILSSLSTYNLARQDLRGAWCHEKRTRKWEKTMTGWKKLHIHTRTLNQKIFVPESPNSR